MLCQRNCSNHSVSDLYAIIISVNIFSVHYETGRTDYDINTKSLACKYLRNLAGQDGNRIPKSTTPHLPLSLWGLLLRSSGWTCVCGCLHSGPSASWSSASSELARPNCHPRHPPLMLSVHKLPARLGIQLCHWDTGPFGRCSRP